MLVFTVESRTCCAITTQNMLRKLVFAHRRRRFKHYIRNGDDMDTTACRVYRKNYGMFLNGKLEGKECRQLLRHIEECAECREELRIQYLLQEGMFRLEHGGTFDINSDFERMLADAQKEVRQESRRKMFYRGLMIVFVGITYYFVAIGIIGY